MKVKRCEWLSRNAEEALLYIGDDEYECVAFSHPCKLDTGDCLAEPLLAISIEGVGKQIKPIKLAITRQGDSLSHEIVGVVTSLALRTVSVGSIVIELDDPLPGDIEEMDVIQFTCGRLDAMA